MKFIVSSEILLKKLQLIGGVLNASNTLPILDDFLFEIKKGELTITASDLETTMVTTISIEAKEDGVRFSNNYAGMIFQSGRISGRGLVLPIMCAN